MGDSNRKSLSTSAPESDKKIDETVVRQFSAGSSSIRNDSAGLNMHPGAEVLIDTDYIRRDFFVRGIRQIAARSLSMLLVATMQWHFMYLLLFCDTRHVFIQKSFDVAIHSFTWSSVEAYLAPPVGDANAATVNPAGVVRGIHNQQQRRPSVTAVGRDVALFCCLANDCCDFAVFAEVTVAYHIYFNGINELL